MTKEKLYDIVVLILTAVFFVAGTWFSLNHDISIIESLSTGGAAAICFQLFFGDPFPEDEEEFED